MLVAQVEASGGGNPPSFEVNPTAVAQPALPFTYYSTNGTSTTFNNSVGSESGHADVVGQQFYGIPSGVATAVAHVDNFEADHFFNSIINTGSTGSLTASVINQSFAFTDASGNLIQDPQVDQAYDNFVVNSAVNGRMTRIFVSAVGNSGKPASPSTMYLNEQSSRSPIGPRAWSFCVELPISAPIPNSPPSVNRVDALT